MGEKGGVVVVWISALTLLEMGREAEKSEGAVAGMRSPAPPSGLVMLEAGRTVRLPEPWRVPRRMTSEEVVVDWGSAVWMKEVVPGAAVRPGAAMSVGALVAPRVPPARVMGVVKV